MHKKGQLEDCCMKGGSEGSSSHLQDVPLDDLDGGADLAIDGHEVLLCAKEKMLLQRRFVSDLACMMINEGSAAGRSRKQSGASCVKATLKS
jgi:hypothetical protein